MKSAPEKGNGLPKFWPRPKLARQTGTLHRAWPGPTFSATEMGNLSITEEPGRLHPPGWQSLVQGPKPKATIGPPHFGASPGEKKKPKRRRALAGPSVGKVLPAWTLNTASGDGCSIKQADSGNAQKADRVKWPQFRSGLKPIGSQSPQAALQVVPSAFGLPEPLPDFFYPPNWEPIEAGCFREARHQPRKKLGRSHRRSDAIRIPGLIPKSPQSPRIQLYCDQAR